MTTPTSGHLCLIYPNAVDDAVLTATPAAETELPVSNLQNARRAKTWRSTSLADQVIRGNFNEVKTISAMAFPRHNLSANASIRYRLWNDVNQGGALLYDSGVLFQGDDLGWGDFDFGVQPWGGSYIFASWAYAFAYLWFDEYDTAQSFQLDVSDPANNAGWMEASRLITGQYFETSEQIDRGLTLTWEDDSRRQRSAGGSRGGERRQTYRRWELKLSVLSEADRAALMDICMHAGVGADMFISCYTGAGGRQERDYAGHVYLAQMPSFGVRVESSDLIDASIVFEEA